MKVEERKLTELKPYKNNPRNNDESIPYVAESIKKFGFQQPIVIDKNGVIVAGHTRYCAAKYLSMKTVPCVIADDLTEEQIKAYRLADNKLGELASWDNALLGDELEELMDEGCDGIQEYFDDSKFPINDDLDVKEVCTCPHCKYTDEVEAFRGRK